MSTIKAFRFPVSVRWEGGRITTASAGGKEELQVATPPEFPSGVEGLWSPEELLVASAGACYAVTLAAVAERYEVPIHSLEVHGTGHISKRDDGRFGFVAIELDAEIEADPLLLAEAEAVATKAEHACLISAALDVPVHVHAVVKPPREVGHLLGHGVPS